MGGKRWITLNGRHHRRRPWLESQNARPGKRGRGLQLIEAHMDEVSISTSSGGGTTIHMVKYEKKES